MRRVRCQWHSIALYRRLEAETAGKQDGGSTSVGPAAHAAALRALLQEAQGADSSSSSDAALDAALQLLATHRDALLGLKDAGLGRAVCMAAMHTLGSLPPQPGSSAVVRAYRTVAEGVSSSREAFLVASPAAGQLTHLLPSVRLALCGLQLLTSCSSPGRPADAKSQLFGLAEAIGGRAGSGQLLALLRLVPAWAQGLQVPHSLWAALLSCARRDVLQPAAAGHGLDAAVASQLGEVCRLLRAELGGKWAAGLETPAKVRDARLFRLALVLRRLLLVEHTFNM